MKSFLVAGILSAIALTPAFAQTTEVLTGTLSITKELNPSICYELDGCYRVLSGGELVIPAGTQILGNTAAALIVEKGGQIFATGTAMNPVVFTSSKSVGSRAPGDWNGVSIAGEAPTNISGGKVINRNCGNISGGGIIPTDNSGTFQYVRIEYAGAGVAGDAENNALNLIAVGSGTTIDHVMVTESLGDAFDFFGGTVKADYLVSYNTRKSDFLLSDGNISAGQFWTSMRLSNAANAAGGIQSNAVVIRNDLSNSSNTPFTHPQLSNMSIIGPNYCSGTPVSSNFKAGIYLYSNAEAEIYNSVITGWPTGLQITDASTIANANLNGTILASYNTFYNNGASYANTPFNFDPSSSGCSPNITDWMEATYPCSQIDNFVRLSLTGYSNSICGNFCTTAPSLTLAGTNNIGAADFSWDAGSTFNHVAYRGSLGSTDYTSGWSKWCPQEETYCTLTALKQQAEPTLALYPNPAKGKAEAIFESEATGLAILKISDQVSGKELRSFKHAVSQAGKQNCSFDVSGIREGVYLVTVRLPDGKVISKAISIQ